MSNKIERLTELYRQLLIEVGEDPEREGLRKTPERAAKALAYIAGGYEQDVQQIINEAVFTSDNSEMVVVKDIELYSMCEHHLLPFIGKCHVAYIPDGKVLGLSKIARIVDVFARRFQIQEELTSQIADTIVEHTGAKGVGVVIEAKHLCMMMRGVEKQNSYMKTSALRGNLRSQGPCRAEFFALIGE